MNRLLAVLVVGLVFAAPASAHGSGSVTRNGSVDLAPAGMPGSFAESSLVAMGFPIEVETTLLATWSTNGGSGPAVEFAVHHHPATGGVVYDRRSTAALGNETWVVPGSEDYWVSWENPSPEPVNVTYYLHADPPPPSPLWYLVPVIFVGSFFSVLWLTTRKKKPPAQEPE